jgi:hypothetical protein
MLETPAAKEEGVRLPDLVGVAIASLSDVIVALLVDANGMVVRVVVRSNAAGGSDRKKQCEGGTCTHPCSQHSAKLLATPEVNCKCMPWSSR